jgi:hypothetical protein
LSDSANKPDNCGISDPIAIEISTGNNEISLLPEYSVYSSRCPIED